MSDDIAPRPRPGFKSRPAFDAAAKAALVAGVMRALIGAVGFAGTLLYIPVTIATPVLAGVTVLMMVTGCTSTWRAVRHGPRRITHVLLALCAVAVVASCALAAWFGPGAFNPVRRMSHTSDAPVIHFEPPPGR